MRGKRGDGREEGGGKTILKFKRKKEIFSVSEW